MRRRPVRFALAASAGLALLVSGCVGAPTRIHTLDAQAPTTAPPAAAYSDIAFRIDAVHIPPSYDRPELIRRTEPYTLTLSDTDRWAAPLGELIRRTLTQDLAQRLPAGSVIFPDAPKPPNAGGLILDILSITPRDGVVDMDVSWTWLAPKIVQPVAVQVQNGLVASSPPAPVAVARPFSLHVSAPVSGSGAAAIAPELSALLAKLADEIAARR